MTRDVLSRAVASVLLIAGLASPVFGQARPATSRLLITVVDPSGAIVPGASVTVVAIDPVLAGRAPIPPVKTTDKGVATIEDLAPGRYSVTAEFAGFELGLLRNLTIRAGENRHVVILPLKGMEASVSVSQDRQMAAADPRGTSFGSALTREQIDALSDDPNEMQQQLQDLVGGGATLRVDSFEGGQLPPKSQIKAIHVTRDAFAAENHNAGSIFVDIITQPGAGPLRVNTGGNFQDGSMTGSNPFVPRNGPEQNKSYNAGLSGSLIRNKASFSITAGQNSFFNTPNINAALPGGTQAGATALRTQRAGASVFALGDYAITRDQTIRLSYSQGSSTFRNLGVGAYDLPERAYGTQNDNHQFRFQEAGPIGRRFFLNTRMDLYWGGSGSTSAVEAPTIRVTDAFTSGGAQIAGSRHNRDLRVMSDLDYVRGIHSIRAGVDLWGTSYRSDERTNYLGTYAFSSLEAYNAGQPTFYTRRIGDPNISYLEAWLGGYIQDDLRLRKNFTLSLGVRYEVQNHLRDDSAIGPRAGITWAPFRSGRTSIRASWGIFYDWISASAYEQTLRFDGFRQQELDIVNPSYPDPNGGAGSVPPVNKYSFAGDLRMPRNARVSVGIDQTLTPKLRGSLLYSDTRTSRVLRGRNLNAPVNGIRPDATLGTVVEAVADARAHGQTINGTLTYNVLAPSAATSQGRFNWKRMAFNVFYTFSVSNNNSDGTFSVPASGTLATEWGPAPGDVRHRISGGFSWTALKNFTANFNWNASSGRPYTITTGLDDNGDLAFNDRPAGTGRNSARYPWWTSVAGTFTYGWSFGRQGAAPGGTNIIIMNGEARVLAPAASTSGRYRINVSVRIGNLFNRYNYSGFSGVMTSPFFMKPTTVNEVRRVNFNVSFSF